MNSDGQLRDFVLNGHLQYVSHLSIDCAVFGFHENQLKILLLRSRYLDGWALPGGHVKLTEHVDVAAQRILKERTGLDDVFLKQYHTFGDPDRLKTQSGQFFMDALQMTVPEDNWLFKRIISMGYYALVEFSQAIPTPDLFTEECLWCDISQLPKLIFDHELMVQIALQTLRLQLHYQPIGYNLLPEKFTMPELQKLYETILGKPLDRRNFQKKMVGLGILDRLDERKNVGPHKSPYYYRFDQENYQKALTEGLTFAL